MNSPVIVEGGLLPNALPSLSQPLQAARQCTLAQPFKCEGVGLHSGVPVHVTVLPAEVNSGRSFVRVDLPGSPVIPATMATVDQTLLSTELRQDNASVRTVEHLLAALVGMGIDNARIEIDGVELPLLDGSARLWVEPIIHAGIVVQDQPRTCYSLREPIWVYERDAFVAAIPAPSLRYTYGIDFDLKAIGNQWYSWSPSSGNFDQEIAPARTFGLAHQIEALRAQGLIQGGSLDNALVCGAEGWLNPPLRFDNEPVRHKLLDLIGDLSLFPGLLGAHVLAYKASHHLHTQLVQQLVAALGVNLTPVG